MWRSFDDLDTRGGPLIARPASDGFEIELESDDRFMISGWVEYEWEDNSAGSTRREVSGSIRIRPTSRFEISLRPRYSWNFNDAQWVENFDANADGEDDQFVYGELDSQTLDLTTRANILFSRDLSLEVYVQPFISAGQYVQLQGDWRGRAPTRLSRIPAQRKALISATARCTATPSCAGSTNRAALCSSSGRSSATTRPTGARFALGTTCGAALWTRGAIFSW